MARVLFVAKELIMEPLGILYLSSALRAVGHTVGLARCDYGESPEEVARKFKPDIFAFSVCSGLEDFYFDLAHRLVGDLELYSRTIWGGPSVTFSPHRYRGLRHVRGEGEDAIVNLVEGREPDHLKLTDLSSIADPDRGLAYQFADLEADPIKNVITRRGCTHTCSYCFNSSWNKLHKGQLPKGIIRYRSPEAVVQECIDLKDHWPLRMINFVDDNFVSSVEWLEKFAEDFPVHVGLPFFCSVRPDDVNAYRMQLIADAGGAVINLAIECANDNNRRNVLLRTGTKEAVLRTIALVHKHGMRTRLQNIIGLPVDDPLSDAYETLDFNIAAQPTSSWCALLQAYPGIKVYDIARERGCIDFDSPKATDSEFFNESMLRIKDKRRIERLHKIWHLAAHYRVVRWLTPLLIRLPLPFSWFKWVFKKSKKWLAERDLWKVFGK